MIYFACLTKFSVVPTHLILHILKVFIDDLTPSNIENVALLLETCGRYLLRSDETRDRMTAMLDAIKRKQGMQHLDQRHVLLLENAYYQVIEMLLHLPIVDHHKCNPPERGPRLQKQRPIVVQFIRHVICDFLAKKTIDKCLRLLRKLNWEELVVRRRP